MNPLCATVSDDFERFLGQVLGWRIGALPHDEPRECNIYLFQTSLYNTMMLRFAIGELLALFSFEMEFHDSGQPPQLSAIHLGIMNLEQSRITKLKLPQICSAVTGSIDRIHMTGRFYLSLKPWVRGWTRRIPVQDIMLFYYSEISLGGFFLYKKNYHYSHLDLFFSTNSFQVIGFSSSISKLSFRSAPA